MQTIHLVRHAHPDADFALRYLGHTDAPLSAEGRSAAESLRAKFAAYQELPLYCSPLRRSYETACIASQRVPRIEPLLREFSFGAFDGLKPEEASLLFPEAFKHLQKHPLDAAPFGGDDWAAVQKRTRQFAESIGRRSCVVVGHQLSIIALIQMLGAAPALEQGTAILPYAGSVSIERNGGGWHRGDAA